MKQNIVEITKGKTGTGLLLENDGYVSLELPGNKKLYESIKLNEATGQRNLPEKLIFDTVFQKFDTPNANGRIYPEAILKREVEKYQQAIKERRAYGECYTPDVLCLTKNGWKELKNVKIGDEVISLNPHTQEIEIVPVINKIEYQYNGKMIRISGRNINDLVTPGHKFPLYDRNHKFRDFYTAEDIFNGKVSSHDYIPKNGEWVEKGDDIFILKGVTSPSERTLKLYPNCENEIAIPMSVFMKFMGIYLSEGHYNKDGYGVCITQVKDNICSEIETMLYELGFNFNINTYEGKKTFTICEPRLHAYVSQFGDCYTKYVDNYLKQQSKENLKIFYDWFVLGDGRVRGDQRVDTNLTDDVFSVSKQLIMDLNEVQLKIGYAGNYHIEPRDNDRYIKNNDGSERLIEGKNCKPLHFSFRSLTKGTYLDKRFISVTDEDYDGDVMCIDLPRNHIWYVMSNGKCHWTGNCNHPESSTIDLSRIAMNIIELHWEGKTLVGKIEVPITDGYRNFGIVSTCADQVAHWILSGLKIGVSSRGLGSVTQRNGILYVGDDFEIICWDVVTQPSTPNAWICTEEGEISLYKESNEINKNKTLFIENVENKYSKFEKWLNN